jgi:hypothetical protein
VFTARYDLIHSRIRGPTAPMHLGLKERALCAPLLVPPLSPEALHVRRRERPLSAKGGIMGEKWLIKFSLQYDFHGNLRCFFLHAAKLWHGPMTLLPLRRKVFWGPFCPKNPTVSTGFEAANLGSEVSMITTRPPKRYDLSHVKHIRFVFEGLRSRATGRCRNFCKFKPYIKRILLVS